MRYDAIIIALSMLLGCATIRGKTSQPGDERATLTQESATTFVQDCVKAWAKKDESVWDKVADGSFIPIGALPTLLMDGQSSPVDLWMTAIPDLTAWMSTHKVAQVAPGLRLVEGIQSTEMRDLRHLSLEQLRGPPNPEIVIPSVQVQSLTLGLDMDGDGEISSGEKTRVHLHNGVLYWEPFGW